MEVRRRGALVGAVIFCTLVACSGGVASADDAEALLKRGNAALKAGDYEKACPALAKSFELSPTAVSAYQSATCEAHAGRFKTATARFARYLELVEALPARERKQHAERIETAKRQRAELEPLVPTVTLSLPAGAPAETIVKCDGVPIDKAQLGAPLPLDPGEHVFSTQAPRGGVRERRITITAGDRQTLKLDVDAPAPDAAVQAPPKPVEPEPDDAPATPIAVETSSLRRPIAYGALALGILGTAAGAVTGILSMQKKGDVDGNCDGSTCNAAGKSAADDGLMLAHLSTIGFAVGVVGVATGVVLLVTAPGPAPAAAQSPSAARRFEIGVAGRW